MDRTTVKIDADTRALLKQMAAQDRLSMIEELERLVTAEWAKREAGK